jgi:hypothetical protein
MTMRSARRCPQGRWRPTAGRSWGRRPGRLGGHTADVSGATSATTHWRSGMARRNRSLGRAASVRVVSIVGPGRMPGFADVPLGAALRVETSVHVRYAMGDELNADMYNYNAGGDEGCPLLVLTPVDESHCVFRRGRGRGYAAAADASNWDFGQDWVMMTTLTTIQPRPPDTTTTHNNQIE